MKKIKKLLQKIFKSFFQLIFKLAYGKIIYNKNNLDSSEISIQTIENKTWLNNKITPYELYEELYDGKEIKFDMTCGGKKINFKFHNNLTITTLDEFNRKIKFT